MEKTFLNAIKNRRSYYNLTDKSNISDEQIIDIIHEIVKNAPSAFNSQSTRLVILLGENHKKFWNIVKDILKKIAKSEEAFVKTEAKINNSFLAGYGTVLFYEDQETVQKLQEKFPSYKENFVVWSQHTNAIHQILIWIALEDEGFGASLQHYNPLIDKAIEEEWGINHNWKLVAQMPFGIPADVPGEKSCITVEDRVKVFI
ncbi:MAG: nitroreductase family protein [Bacteroidales bacterium]|jgi:predicted oxidoreductase (fatty acid repression mutant protein)